MEQSFRSSALVNWFLQPRNGTIHTKTTQTLLSRALTIRVSVHVPSVISLNDNKFMFTRIPFLSFHRRNALPSFNVNHWCTTRPMQLHSSVTCFPLCNAIKTQLDTVILGKHYLSPFISVAHWLAENVPMTPIFACGIVVTTHMGRIYRLQDVDFLTPEDLSPGIAIIVRRQ